MLVRCAALWPFACSYLVLALSAWVELGNGLFVTTLACLLTNTVLFFLPGLPCLWLPSALAWSFPRRMLTVLAVSVLLHLCCVLGFSRGLGWLPSPKTYLLLLAVFQTTWFLWLRIWRRPILPCRSSLLVLFLTAMLLAGLTVFSVRKIPLFPDYDLVAAHTAYGMLHEFKPYGMEHLAQFFITRPPLHQFLPALSLYLNNRLPLLESHYLLAKNFDPAVLSHYEDFTETLARERGVARAWRAVADTTAGDGTILAGTRFPFLFLTVLLLLALGLFTAGTTSNPVVALVLPATLLSCPEFLLRGLVSSSGHAAMAFLGLIFLLAVRDPSARALAFFLGWAGVQMNHYVGGYFSLGCGAFVFFELVRSGLHHREAGEFRRPRSAYFQVALYAAAGGIAGMALYLAFTYSLDENLFRNYLLGKYDFFMVRPFHDRFARLADIFGMWLINNGSILPLAGLGAALWFAATAFRPGPSVLRVWLALTLIVPALHFLCIVPDPTKVYDYLLLPMTWSLALLLGVLPSRSHFTSAVLGGLLAAFGYNAFVDWVLFVRVETVWLFRAGGEVLLHHLRFGVYF
ncbi:MAG: hypothetical protein A2284_07800 [Deltaproteobacteria bacterium RIFOXYA12_FULL_61_11]|nr:MAG: hypothetical protein A2284_07800 [Deltaproteobacteria bacterium RIFOXYA12_FULL_61_11]